MASWKRFIYGLPQLRSYRAHQARSLATKLRDHPLGFRFAGHDVFFLPEWEARERALLFDGIAGADVFVDIGANQGIYSCYAGLQNKHVVAVEPEPNNLHILLSNLGANGFTAEVFPIALSDSAGSASLYGASDTASLKEGWEGVPRHFQQRVPVNTLDNLFADRWADKRVFIKVDVEGLELQVLRGASKMLARPNRARWFIETMPRLYDPERSINADFAHVFEQMFAAGYTCRTADATSMAVDMKAVERWANLPAVDPALATNFLFE